MRKRSQSIKGNDVVIWSDVVGVKIGTEFFGRVLEAVSIILEAFGKVFLVALPEGIRVFGGRADGLPRVGDLAGLVCFLVARVLVTMRG